MRNHAGFVLWWAIAGLASTACGADAQVEINSASLAQLEALGGVGTELASHIVHQRAKARFIDWADAQRRLKGLGPKLAARLSEQGLTVDGAPFTPAPAAPAASR
jgi:competence protein ComEA